MSEEKEKKLSPFDLANNMMKKTGHMDYEELKGVYNAFMINRIFSNGPHSIFFANEMNQCWQMPVTLQFDFYYFGLPKSNRYNPWPKKEKELEFKIDLVKRRYNYSTLRAKEVIPLIDELDLWDEIEADLNLGGGHTVKKRGRKKKKKIFQQI